MKNLEGLMVDENIDWDVLVKKTDGYSGADVTNVI